MSHSNFPNELTYQYGQLVYKNVNATAKHQHDLIPLQGRNITVEDKYQHNCPSPATTCVFMEYLCL